MIHRAPFAALVVALGLALVTCGPPHDAAETPAAAPAPEPQVTAPVLGNPPPQVSMRPGLIGVLSSWRTGSWRVSVVAPHGTAPGI